MKIITVVELNDAGGYPPVPVQSLLKVLLKKGYKVNFIGRNISNISKDISSSPNYSGYEILYIIRKTILGKIKNRICFKKMANKYVDECMKTSDILWTTSMITARILGKNMLKYKNILQLMELAEHGYEFRKLIKFPIEKYARQSWKTVACEINRAYIQKTWWDLPQTPYVLPNKPFDLNPGDLTSDVKIAIKKIKCEKKKIILYLGGIYSDRSFKECAQAISEMDDYVLYIAGKYYDDEGKRALNYICQKYGAVYLGSFRPPMHLSLVRYAYIGLLPYKTVKREINSELNALYCAPNKIWEYTGFGVPMVGSDVLGLKLPFEQWNIGCCCDIDNGDSIKQAIGYVDAHHEEMSQNCYKFYDSVDLNKIVAEILEDDN